MHVLILLRYIFFAHMFDCAYIAQNYNNILYQNNIVRYAL